MSGLTDRIVVSGSASTVNSYAGSGAGVCVGVAGDVERADLEGVLAGGQVGERDVVEEGVVRPWLAALLPRRGLRPPSCW